MARTRVKLDIRDTDKGWKKLGRVIRLSGRPSVTAGIHGRDKGRTEGAINNVGLAAIHEFGAPQANIPERSFIRSTVDDQLKTWQHLLGKLGGSIYALELPVEGALEIVGLKMSSDIQRTINKGNPDWDALKPATIARKASAKALIDTRELLRSVKHYVGSTF